MKDKQTNNIINNDYDDNYEHLTILNKNIESNDNTYFNEEGKHNDLLIEVKS